MDRPFSVTYKIDRSNKEKFAVEQHDKEGTRQLLKNGSQYFFWLRQPLSENWPFLH